MRELGLYIFRTFMKPTSGHVFTDKSPSVEPSFGECADFNVAVVTAELSIQGTSVNSMGNKISQQRASGYAKQRATIKQSMLHGGR